MRLINLLDKLCKEDMNGKYKLTEEGNLYVDNLSYYIQVNCTGITKKIYNNFLWSLNYKDSKEFINDLLTDCIKLKLYNLKDNYEQLSIVIKSKELNNNSIFKPLRYLKKACLDQNHFILEIISVMMLNFSCDELKLSLHDYKRLIEYNLSFNNYFNFRLKQQSKTSIISYILNFKCSKYDNNLFIRYLNKELEAVNKEINEAIEIKHQFKFLLSNNELMSLSIQLQQLGFINDAISFSQLFKVKNEINELPSNKIVWNGSLLELAYFFKILIYSKIIHYSNITLLYKNISDVFMDKSNNIIKNKSLSSKASRTLKINPNLFNDIAPQKPKNLILLYELVKSFSSEWDTVNTVK